jgi:ELWxxDGT repeat protein
MVANINPSEMVAVGSTVYFVAADAAHGEQLWKSDGTPGGTTMVTDINPTAGGLKPSVLTNVNGMIFFEATDNVHHEGLWRSDGTAAGTVIVKDIFPGGTRSTGYYGLRYDANTTNPANVNGTLFFATNDGTHGTELWKSDGTAAGTAIVKDIFPGSTSAKPITNTSPTAPIPPTSPT